MLETKECARCKHPKLRNAFSNDTNRPDGKNPYCKECIQTYYLNNREEILANCKNYRAIHPERLLIAHARKRAKIKDLPFSITEQDIDIPETCPVLGIQLKVGRGRFGPNSPTIDRIVPRLGYVPGNVVVISFRANLIKNDATVDEVSRVLLWMKQCLGTQKPQKSQHKRHRYKTRLEMGQLRRGLTPEQANLCRQLHSEGLSMLKIADHLKVKIKPVFNAINRRGVYATD